FWQGSCQGSGQNVIYTAAGGDFVKAFPVTNGALAASASSQSLAALGAAIAPAGPLGESPAVSSNGATNGIVWVIHAAGYGANGAAPAPAVLHAYDACNLGTELYNSSKAAGDAAGNAVKFTVPTVSNGHVYVGTQAELTVYGFR